MKLFTSKPQFKTDQLLLAKQHPSGLRSSEYRPQELIPLPEIDAYLEAHKARKQTVKVRAPAHNLDEDGFEEESKGDAVLQAAIAATNPAAEESVTEDESSVEETKAVTEEESVTEDDEEEAAVSFVAPLIELLK